MKSKNYICSVCADSKGYRWPEGHCATIHEGNCDFCKKKRSLSHVTDWNRPNANNHYGDISGREF